MTKNTASGAYLVEQLKGASLSLAPALLEKNITGQERASTDKHASFLGTFVNYSCKKFYNIWPGSKFYSPLLKVIKRV
jgi:hypothetical protein